MSDPQAGWAAGFVEPLRVRPGSKVARPAPPGTAADPVGRTPPR